MRRIAVISWLVILSVTIGGAVWGAQRIAAKPCTAAPLPTNLTTLQPIDELPLAAGTIVAVDPGAGRVTVNHRGIGRFYLEPGTSIFHVEDRAVLTWLTPGDKIHFDAVRDGKRYAITRIAHTN